MTHNDNNPKSVNAEAVDSSLDAMKDDRTADTVEPEEVEFLLEALDSAIDAMKKNE